MKSKPILWHRLPFFEFVKYELTRPAFRPFAIGGIVSLFVCTFGPTMGMTQEQKEKSPFWQKIHGNFDYSHHH